MVIETARAVISEYTGDGAVWVRLPFSRAERAATLLTTAVVETLDLETELAERLAVLLAASATALIAGRERSAATRLVELEIEVDQGLAELRVIATEREGRDPDPADAPDGVAAATSLTGALAGLERVRGGVGGTLSLERRSRASAPIRVSFRGPLFVRAVLPRALARTAEDGDCQLESVSRIAGLGDRIATTILADRRFERLRVNFAQRSHALETRLWQLSASEATDVEAMVRRDFPEAEVQGFDHRSGREPSDLLSISMPISAGR